MWKASFYCVFTSSVPSLPNMKIVPHFPPDIFMVLARLVTLAREKNIRITEVCNKYLNCLCYLKKHTHSFDLLQENQMKSLGILWIRYML